MIRILVLRDFEIFTARLEPDPIKFDQNLSKLVFLSFPFWSFAST